MSVKVENFDIDERAFYDGIEVHTAQKYEYDSEEFDIEDYEPRYMGDLLIVETDAESDHDIYIAVDESTWKLIYTDTDD